MADYVWPDDLPPYQMTFYLQAHTGGSESPFTRATKVYGLSAPRWICSMSFRGGYNGLKDQGAFGPRLDGWIAKLKGRLNRVEVYDFRRPKPRSPVWPRGVSNLAATAGDTSMTITGLQPGTKVYVGDYLGGDGRPHLVIDDPFVVADSSGEAEVNFEPPLVADIGAGDAIFRNVTGMFRLTSDDAGINPVEVGDLQTMTLEFVEDL